MRLWSIHPKYLDRAGLLAVWREALLAKAVLRGKTLGYRSHPQLERFRAAPGPVKAIDEYLAGVHEEATGRGYRFDRSKFWRRQEVPRMPVHAGQLEYEMHRLRGKLWRRDRAGFALLRAVRRPKSHPLFVSRPGGVEAWERR